jgi:hypothetical protein
MDAATDWVVSNGMALDFDGSDDVVRVSTTAPTFPFTLSGWFKTTSDTLNQFPFVFCRSGSDDGHFAIRFAGNVAGDPITCRHEGDSGGTVGEATGAAFTNNTWIHVAAVFRSSTYRQIWVNGIEGTANTTSVTTPTINRLAIGRFDRLNPAVPFQGTIDDCRVYSRELTPPEIRLLASRRGIGLQSTPRHTDYLETREKTYSVIVKSQQEHSSLSEGLVGAWCPSLGATGYRLIDRSGYGNHGTLTNMTSDDWVVSGGAGALDFDGSDDFIDWGTLIPLSGTKTITVAGWVYQSTVNDAGFFNRYNTNLAGANLRRDLFGVNEVTAKGQVCAIIQRAGGGTNYLLFHSTNTISANTWNHVAASVFIDGVNSSASLYLNGVSQTVNTAHAGTRPTSFDANNSVPYTSMRYIPGSGTPYYMAGQLDDIRVYNRILSATEIRQLASRRGIGLRSQKQTMFYQFPSGSKRRRILTGMT